MKDQGRGAGPAVPVEDRSSLLTTCGRLLGTVGLLFLVVVPAGLALAAVHFLLGGLVLARRFWPLVVAVLLLFAVVTLFPLGLRISWPFLGLTALYATTLVLVVARHREFE